LLLSIQIACDENGQQGRSKRMSSYFLYFCTSPRVYSSFLRPLCQELFSVASALVIEASLRRVRAVDLQVDCEFLLLSVAKVLLVSAAALPRVRPVSPQRVQEGRRFHDATCVKSHGTPRIGDTSLTSAKRQSTYVRSTMCSNKRTSAFLNWLLLSTF